ncbi:MAG: hypothetical protein HY834_03935 [Devosia nanyangense]|uniref:BrnA antitoxin of type II toxin-antitoxin system n=1 Tax=Devosia nanyangense TaxID=1228055 RepID=A0A933L263_9HYPH|nr:hypothetical protein [Devosia nanyangense]
MPAEIVAAMERGQRQRLAALVNLPDEEIDFSDIPAADEKFLQQAIRPSVYPPVPLDAKVVEWFMKRSGNRMSLMFDVNRVLQDYIKTQDRKAARKKAG